MEEAWYVCYQPTNDQRMVEVIGQHWSRHLCVVDVENLNRQRIIRNRITDPNKLLNGYYVALAGWELELMSAIVV